MIGSISFTFNDVQPQNIQRSSGCPTSTSNGTGDFNHHLSGLSSSDLGNQYSINNAYSQSEKALHSSLIDNGNTQAMLAFLDTSNSSGKTVAVRNTLLSASPWLSSEALLKAAVMEYALPDSVLLEILLANPDGIQNSILQQAQNKRYVPMPQELIDTVLANKSTITTRTWLEDSLQRHLALRSAAVYELTSRIMLDEDSVDYTLLRSWLDSLQDPMADVDKALSYMVTDKPDTALNYLQEIYSKYQLSYEDSLQINSIDDVLTGYVNWFNAQTDTNLIAGDMGALDSTSLAQLDTFASNQNEFLKGTQMVRNLLNAQYGGNYFTEAQLPDVAPEMRRAAPEQILVAEEKEKLLLDIKVYPNPAKDELTFEATTGKELLIEIYDIYGRMIEHFYLKEKVTINTTGWTAGVYAWRTKTLGTRNTQGKVVIAKW